MKIRYPLLCFFLPIVHAMTLTYQKGSLTADIVYPPVSYPVTPNSMVPLSHSLTGILVHLKNGCETISYPHISQLYSLIALLDLSTSFDFDNNCNSFSLRINNTIKSSSRIIGIVYNPPKNISEFNTIPPIPLFRFDSPSVFSELEAATLGTVGVSDSTRTTNTYAITVRIAMDIDSSYIWKVAIGSGIATLIVLFAGLCIWHRRNERLRRRMINQQIELLRTLQFERDERLQARRPTLQPSLLSKLPVKKFLFAPSISSKSSKQDKGLEISDGQCAICLEYFKKGEDTRPLNCGHTFHLECIDEWLLRRSVVCPLCRMDVRTGIEGVTVETESTESLQVIVEQSSVGDTIIHDESALEEIQEENQLLENEPGSSEDHRKCSSPT